MSGMPVNTDLRLTLLNPWQRGFPLEREPFAHIASIQGLTTDEVLAGYARLQSDGALSRIGGVFAGNAGGAALLAAMAVPPERLDAVAAVVSSHPGVNHNYQREHHFNLWFVMTGRDRAAVDAAIDALEAATGLAALRLRMLRPYRIDLGFDLNGGSNRRRSPAGRAGQPAPAVDPADWPLAAQVESGLPLEPRPFDRWAERLGRRPEAVIDTLAGWLRGGTLSRFGTVVRHHELGWNANAMTVFDVPDDRVDACGAALARIPGVTLAYRRERAALWRYNLYCMVHGRSREAVQQLLDAAIEPCGLAECPRLVLFSRRRFKQTGARRFRDRLAESATTSTAPPLTLTHREAHHAPA